MMSFLFYSTIVAFISVCVILVLLILIQKGRGGGLSSAFGGAGGNTAFGAKTGDVLTWATSVIFGLFVVLAIILNLLSNYRHNHASNGLTPVLAPIPTLPTPAGESPTTMPASMTPPTSQPA